MLASGHGARRNVPGSGEITIRLFQPEDQSSARQLILDGLREYFGALDDTLNNDLADIQASYAARGHLFLVATIDFTIVGTGALLVHREEGPIVRVSVASRLRRAGIGRAILAALLAEAEARGWPFVWMETNDDWPDAIGFYQAAGFEPCDHRDGCVFMRRRLDRNPVSGNA